MTHPPADSDQPDQPDRPDPQTDGVDPIDIDPKSPRPERLHNYLVGGDAHFAADRHLAAELTSTSPVDVAAASASVQSLGAFMTRTVRYLVRRAGVRQFFNAGTPVPTGKGVHVVAQKFAPETRVVYASSDPVVLAHAHQLKSTIEGATAFIHASLRRHLTHVLAETAETLDLTRPVAVLLLGYLNFIPDDHEAHHLVARLLDTVPSGSYLVVAHTSGDLHQDMDKAAQHLRNTTGWPFALRTRAQIARFLGGLELVEPGLVQIDDWRLDDDEPPPDSDEVPIYGVVARKP